MRSAFRMNSSNSAKSLWLMVSLCPTLSLDTLLSWNLLQYTSNNRYYDQLPNLSYTVELFYQQTNMSIYVYYNVATLNTPKPVNDPSISQELEQTNLSKFQIVIIPPEHPSEAFACQSKFPGPQMLLHTFTFTFSSLDSCKQKKSNLRNLIISTASFL